MPNQNLPSITLYKRIAISFLAVAIILVLVIVYFSWGKAAIKIEPARKTNKAEFFIDLGQRSEATEALANLIPAAILETNIEDAKTFPTTGKKSIENKGNFVGTITVHNESGQEYTFVRTTRFLSADGILFRMQNPAKIPANGNADVEVYSDDKKFSGSLGPTKFTIPGLNLEKQKLVYGVTEKPLAKGGTEVYYLTEEDAASARQDLIKQLKTQALSELQNGLKFRSRLFNEATQVEIVDEETTPKMGELAENFEMKLKIKVIALSLDKSELENEMEMKITEQLPAGRELLNFNPDAIEYTMEKYDPNGQIITLKVLYNVESAITKNNKIFDKENLAGLNEGEIKNYFMGFEDVKSADVKFSPFWVRRAPNLTDRIDIILIK
ncbi:MAG: hypothetical protein V1688_00985 [bacterium]